MKNLYIDFDGVILDTIEVTYSMIKEQGIDPTDQKETKKFYATLDWAELLKITPIINDSINCINKIISSEKYDVAILTHIHSLPEAVEKVNYIRKHFKGITVIPVPKDLSKTQMVHAEDAILIDDFSGNLVEWEASGGIGVRFSKKMSGKGFVVIDKLDKLLELSF